MRRWTPPSTGESIPVSAVLRHVEVLAGSVAIDGARHYLRADKPHGDSGAGLRAGGGTGARPGQQKAMMAPSPVLPRIY